VALIPLLLAGIGWVASPAEARPYGGYTDWKVITAGGTGTCAIRSTKQLYCWGTDGSGSSGVQFSSAADWKTVSAGNAHTCAIRGADLLFCWGSDTDGQLGNGASGATTSPSLVASVPTEWRSVSSGTSHTCGIRTSSRFLFCWGSDADGQLGNGADGGTDVPVQITGAANWNAVSAGTSHTCAIRNSGLLCWGSDADGQIGNGGDGSPASPQPITSATDWKSVSVGDSHSCAIRSTGKLYCWGSDTEGQIGNGSGGGGTTSPTQITSATDWTSVSAGAAHTCAIRGAGLLYCWGSNDYHQTVEAGGGDVGSPQRISGYSDWRAVDAGKRHTCALRGTGSLYCWGSQTPPSSKTPAGSGYPANVLNLKPWKLTTPVDGSDAGAYADEIKQPQLATYRNPAFFHTTVANNAVVFRVNAGGAKTPGSVFARSEMREMVPYNGTSARSYNWTNRSGTHTMTIRQAITALPPKLPRVVVGQIHDPSDEVLMVRLDGSRLYLQARYPADATHPDGRYVDKTLTSTYKLGTPFTVSIVAKSSAVYGYLNGSLVASFTNLPSVKAADGTYNSWYFKAGCYLQTNVAKGEAPDSYGESIIYALGISHS
jgi:alpha-tubulin suppressor-like RCC1 family protein